MEDSRRQFQKAADDLREVLFEVRRSAACQAAFAVLLFAAIALLACDHSLGALICLLAATVFSVIQFVTWLKIGRHFGGSA